MKSYGLDLQHTDVNSNADQIVTGTSLPLNPVTGAIFYLTQVQDNFQPGNYSFNGTTWIAAGDITSIQAGEGLIGGGISGDVAISLDKNVVTTIVQQQIQQITTQQTIDPVAMSLIFGS